MCRSENNFYKAWISLKTLVVVVGAWNKQVTSRMNPIALGSSTPEPPLAFSCHTSVDTTQFEAFDVFHLPQTNPVTHKKLRNWDMTSSIYFLLFVWQILLTDGYLHFRQCTSTCVPSEMIIRWWTCLVNWYVAVFTSGQRVQIQIYGALFVFSGVGKFET